MPAALSTESFHEAPFAPEALWPILSKTDWINRSVGLPPVTYDIRPRPEGGTVAIANARFAGATLRWEERPFEWREPDYYHVHRIFHSGPFLEGFMGMDFSPTANGSRIRVHSSMTPRNALGYLLGKFVLGPKATRDMGRLIEHAIAHLKGLQPVALPKLEAHAVAENAFASGLDRLAEFGAAPEQVERLARLLRGSPDVELTRIRPLSVAKAWTQDRWETLRLFLNATRAGLLDLSWEVLCPNCRSSRQPQTSSLRGVKSAMHCEACQISYDGEFDKSVELKFSVNPSVRPCLAQTFCLAGPGGKPHIVCQFMVPPNGTRRVQAPSVPGLCRMRSPQIRKALAFAPGELGRPRAFACETEGFAEWESGQAPGGTTSPRPSPPSDGGEGEKAPQVHREGPAPMEGNVLVAPGLTFHNPNPFEVQVIFERLDWSDEILTAAEVTNWQGFRDLFSNEVLSPNEQVTVGQQIILFTDLRGSTAMYCGIGDAPAYALVREHFTILLDCVRENHGGVVKTIGDAVMAVFSKVPDALRAVREMHEKLAAAQLRPAAEAAGEALILKSSLHIGPCLAVNANDKLDFFGTTINLAARLVDRCKGGDLTVSDAFYHHPDTQAFLGSWPHPAEPFEVQFRGFEAPAKVWRVPILGRAG